MLEKQAILQQLQAAKLSLQQKYGLKTMALFGSYSRNDATADSDVDVLVEFDQPIGIRFIDLADELEALIHHKVDLVSKKAIKPKYFAFIQPDLIYV